MLRLIHQGSSCSRRRRNDDTTRNGRIDGQYYGIVLQRSSIRRNVFGTFKIFLQGGMLSLLRRCSKSCQIHGSQLFLLLLIWILFSFILSISIITIIRRDVIRRHYSIYYSCRWSTWVVRICSSRSRRIRWCMHYILDGSIHGYSTNITIGGVWCGFRSNVGRGYYIRRSWEGRRRRSYSCNHSLLLLLLLLLPPMYSLIMTRESMPWARNLPPNRPTNSAEKIRTTAPLLVRVRLGCSPPPNKGLGCTTRRSSLSSSSEG
mmetsp:Transcript_21518/g.32561  ORF Transcript_21518/g.32561 Transcript_21518/m.32561 type:complete len:261 (-) Transcript_21518:285-1067(-)